MRDQIGRNDLEVLRRLATDQNAFKVQQAPTRILLCSALEDRGDHRQEEEVLRLAWRLHPSVFWVNFELGAAHWRGIGFNRLEEAVRFFSAAVTIRPRSPGAHNDLGNTRFAQGKLEEAIAEHRAALRLKPDYPEAHNNLGAALRDQPAREREVVARQYDLAPPDYCDPVIEVYKKDVDRTLLRENLKLTVEERFLKFERFWQYAQELREAGRKARQTGSGPGTELPRDAADTARGAIPLPATSARGVSCPRRSIMAGTIDYIHLGPREGSGYQQFFVRGRNLRAETLYRATVGPEPRTIEEVAQDYDLPVEAVREAVHYCVRNAALLQREREEDWAESQSRGLVAASPPASDAPVVP